MTGAAPHQTREILACAEQGVRVSRRAAVEDLARLQAWADAHSSDPQAEPGAVPVQQGGPRLVRVGGEGTPEVSDLCFAEIAIARQAGEQATRNATADALDLRHRLPATWAGLQALRGEAWVGRRVARMTRTLSQAAVAMVDTAVAAGLDESAGRVITIAEAAIIAADPDAHRDRITANQTKRGVWLSQPRPGDTVDDTDPTAGVRTLIGRLEEADAIELYAAVEDLADALEQHGDHHPDNPPTRDQLRADALALLARPADALAFLDNLGTSPDTDTTDATDTTDTTEDPTSSRPRPSRRRRDAVVHVHLSAAALAGMPGAAGAVARVEELRPMLLDQLARLLAHSNIRLTPVVDLNQVHNVNHYEHPTTVKRRTRLRVHGDAFPHTTSHASVRIDHDHPTPYDRDRTTRPNRRPQRRPTHPTTPPRQDPRRHPGGPDPTRRLPLDRTPRPDPDGHPHRHQDRHAAHRRQRQDHRRDLLKGPRGVLDPRLVGGPSGRIDRLPSAFRDSRSMVASSVTRRSLPSASCQRASGPANGRSNTSPR